MEFIIEILVKAASFISRSILRRGGETWPGEIALKLDPHIGHKLEKYFDEVIYVIGTNGKTSTCRLLVQVLRDSGRTVITNPTGANQLNGIISSVLSRKKLLSKNRYCGVFEVDENAFPILHKTFSPTMVIILNVLRDQMDRYGEVNSITGKWKEVLNESRKTVVIANAHDPGVYELVDSLDPSVERLYYGVPEPFLQKDTKVFGDFVYCPRCSSRFVYKGRYVSHIGSWRCSSCGFKPHDVFRYTPQQLAELEELPSYFVINSQSVFLAAQKMVIHPKRVMESLLNWEPAFGRGERVTVENTTYTFYLGKNPSSWTVVFESLSPKSMGTSALLLGLNNRVPDGHDVSWIWDVELNPGLLEAARKVCVYGDRAYDMAERLKIEGKIVDLIEPEVDRILGAIKASKEKKVIVIANYSALLEIRKAITGKAIL